MLRGRTVFVTGGSRGIGLSIAERCARDGANVVIAAKTDKVNPKLPGTIFSAQQAIEKAGGKCLPLKVDIRFEDQIQAAVDQAVKTFGGIDILINNASAISLTGTLETPVKTYDLMHQINLRGTWLTSKICLPHLLKSKNPHILNISPPLDMHPKWFGGHVAYTMAKYGMSMCVLGMAEEFQKEGVAVNALWPRTAIATAAVQNLLGGDTMMDSSRKPEIMADAAYWVLTQPSRNHTGQFFIDDEILIQKCGKSVKDLDVYANKPGHPLVLDFFLSSDIPGSSSTVSLASALASSKAKL